MARYPATAGTVKLNPAHFAGFSSYGPRSVVAERVLELRDDQAPEPALRRQGVCPLCRGVIFPCRGALPGRREVESRAPRGLPRTARGCLPAPRGVRPGSLGALPRAMRGAHPSLAGCSPRRPGLHPAPLEMQSPRLRGAPRAAEKSPRDTEKSPRGAKNAPRAARGVPQNAENTPFTPPVAFRGDFWR
jgi:hypothetical protein